MLAAGGYPADYDKGDVIAGLNSEFAGSTKVFHAGTKTDGDAIVTSGGRVLCVTALGDTVSEAQQKAYAGVDNINWNNVYFRKDIGYQAIAREQNK